MDLQKESVKTNNTSNKTIYILKFILHFISEVFLYSIFLIMIIVFITLITYFIDLKKNVDSGNYTPPLFNAYVIVSPSMVPNIKVEDVVIVRRVNTDRLKLNDVITFDSRDVKYSGLTITHRIIGIENSKKNTKLFRTKGDNNNSADSSLVKEEDIYGKVFLVIPKLGYLQYFLSQWYGWILVIVVPCIGIIIYDLLKIFKIITGKNKSTQVPTQNEEKSKEKEDIELL